MGVCFHRYNIHIYCFGDWGGGCECSVPPTLVCRLILHSAHLASIRVLKMTSHQKKSQYSMVPSRRKIMHAIHKAGVGVRHRGIKTCWYTIVTNNCICSYIFSGSFKFYFDPSPQPSVPVWISALREWLVEDFQHHATPFLIKEDSIAKIESQELLE